MLDLYRSLPDVAPLEMANATRSVAVHAEHMRDSAEAKRLWLEVRERYAALDTFFHELTGVAANPGVLEADRHLAAIASHQ